MLLEETKRLISKDSEVVRESIEPNYWQREKITSYLEKLQDLIVIVLSF